MSAKRQKRTLVETEPPASEWEFSAAQQLLASLVWLRGESAGSSFSLDQLMDSYLGIGVKANVRHH